MKDLEGKLSRGLNETRILGLVVQLLIGFQFSSFFQGVAGEPTEFAAPIQLGGLLCLVASLALVVAPSAYHQTAERGNDSPAVLALAGRCVTVALVPLAAALAGDLVLAADRVIGRPAAVAVGTAMLIVAIASWFAPGWRGLGRQYKDGSAVSDEATHPTPLPKRIDQVLTEARVVLPGTQALLGFQFTAVLSNGFARLPQLSQVLHVASLLLVALAIVSLIAPAAYHRLAAGGEDSEAVHQFASRMVVVAMGLLAVGLSGDVFVVAALAVGTRTGIILAVAAFIVLMAAWFAYPLLRRRSPKV